MHIKRYRGAQLSELMRQIHEDLGPDAVILHTRTARTSTLGGLLGGGSTVEIVAAVDTAPAGVRSTEGPEPDAAAGHARGSAPTSRGRGSSAADVRSDGALAAELRDLRRLLLRAAGARALPDHLAPVYAALVDRGIDETLAFHAIEQALDLASAPPGRTAGTVTAAVEAALAALTPVADVPLPPRGGVLAFVGPPGTGKTSILMKLAVHCRLADVPVEIVSLDGARVGAAAQLHALAGILGVPCTLVLSVEEATASRRSVKTPGGARATEVVRLLDTPGVPVPDAASIAALAELLAAAGPSAVHLVTSATTKTADVLAAVHAFAPLNPSRLCVTRLDETTTPGSVLSASVACGLPLAYLGRGTDVPDDLEVASGLALARRILPGELRQ